MSANSTMDITREDALREIVSHLFDATNKEIADLLYELVGRQRLYNFCIVSSYTGDGEGLEYQKGMLG